VNIAEKAHIYAFSPKGPRGNEGVDKAQLNDAGNLLLVCHDCHRTIDSTPNLEVRYPASRLQAWKADHEQRIETVTGIAQDKGSHIVLYGANIGAHRSPLQYMPAAEAMFPERYPARDRPITLGMSNSALGDDTESFWNREAENLLLHFEKRVREPQAGGEIEHLSIFALAPQPLLILLGAQLIDIDAADVYQRHREPPTWRWALEAEPVKFRISEPRIASGPPALVFSLSANIDSARAHAVNPEFSIWTISIDHPHNDFLQSRAQLQAFRKTVRALLDQIKLTHGQGSELSIFPAMPVACAVELGRLRMPKADLPWEIFDQLPGRGFTSALRVPFVFSR
jgi:hypothetical protein